MSFYYEDGVDCKIMSFDVNPQIDVNAPAKIWIAGQGEEWKPMNTDTAGATALWSGDWHLIDESQLATMQSVLRTRRAGYK